MKSYFTLPRLAALAAILVGPSFSAVAQVADQPDGKVAGIAANYTEARVGTYTLPEILVTSDGKPVKSTEDWFSKRRPEIVKLFEENQYGRSPDKPAGLHFDVFDKGTPVFDGKAVRRQVTVYFSKDENGPKMDVLLYLPAHASGPVPVMLQIGFSANSTFVDDPGVKPGEVWDPKQKKRVPPNPNGRRFGHLDVPAFVEKGLGVATVNYADIDPDALGAIAFGVRQLYLKPGQTEPAADEWGSISAWAWGLSRVLDYFETDHDVDAKRVALFGVSRLGKTVLWAGAHDQRFAAVIASCSGEGGAALSRRNYGETVAHLVAPGRYPYQFSANYQKWAGRANDAPMDSHMLVALMAPRPLLLQTGNTDTWSDPKGEYLAALAATPVYALFGKTGPNGSFPEHSQLVGGTLSYYMHAGGHGTVPSDWPVYVQFLEKNLKPGS